MKQQESYFEADSLEEQKPVDLKLMVEQHGD